MPVFFPTETTSAKQNFGISSGTNNTLNFGQVCGESFLGYFLIALNVLLVFVGVFNNCLVTSIVCRTRQMQNPTNILLSNNAIAEVVFLLASGSFFVIGKLSRMGDFTVSQSLMFLRTSGFFGVMILVSYYVASVNLALLAIERFNALCNPMKIRRRLSKRSAKLSILTMWLTATIFVLPLIVSLKLSNAGYMNMGNLIYYHCTLSGTVSAFAGCTITYCYGRIIHGIHIAESIFNSTCSVTASEDIRAKRNIVKMLLSITLTFVLTKFPAAAYSALILVIRPSTYCPITFVITLAHLSAFLNPIIYFVFNSNYRKEGRRLLKSCFRNKVVRHAVKIKSNTTSNLEI